MAVMSEQGDEGARDRADQAEEPQGPVEEGHLRAREVVPHGWSMRKSLGFWVLAEVFSRRNTFDSSI